MKFLYPKFINEVVQRENKSKKVIFGRDVTITFISKLHFPHSDYSNL